ncbi:hypothetical protein SAMN03080601_01143 [Alkalitalea saponilacus]|uniref:Acetyltransferase (GNAT) domain-containing protein n=1 Tax=Alkalitalea saponilacus TaxID=889453 RepID=A0A1T5DVJ2_9BACT|nr:hypothetical protein SAMN03080601_01143 [Alkalitalea saponilacus]
MIISTPRFKTKRFILKSVTEADKIACFKYFNDYEVIRYLSNEISNRIPARDFKRDWMIKRFN